MNISDDVIISLSVIIFVLFPYTELIIITVTVLVYKGKKVPYMVYIVSYTYVLKQELQPIQGHQLGGHSGWDLQALLVLLVDGAAADKLKNVQSTCYRSIVVSIGQLVKFCKKTKGSVLHKQP